MRINKGFFLVGLVIAAILFWEVVAHADESDQSTKITFRAPIQIPGQALAAGAYLFKLADSDNRNLVQVFNSDGTILYATLMTVTTERSEPTDDTAITVADRGAGKPHALLKWFYPGRVSGIEFVYSDSEAKQLAQDRQQTIVANQPAEAGD